MLCWINLDGLQPYKHYDADDNWWCWGLKKCYIGTRKLDYNARILKAHSHSLTHTQWVEVKSELLSSACHSWFWIARGLVSYLTMRLYTHPPAIQKQHRHLREAPTEPPLIQCECEWAFRIQPYVFVARSSSAFKWPLTSWVRFALGTDVKRVCWKSCFFPGAPVSSHRVC
jgi:hypothetical protein